MARPTAARSSASSRTATRSASATTTPTTARATTRTSPAGTSGTRSSATRSAAATRATATRSAAARSTGTRSSAPRAAAPRATTSRGTTSQATTSRRAATPGRSATTATLGAGRRSPAAEDWYRLGVLDAVAGEHEAVAASIRIPFLRLNVERPGRRRTVLAGRPAALAETERAAGRPKAEPAEDAGWRIGPVELPSPRKTAYYLGLGALAALQVVEWPVVAAIAAGTWVAQHTRPESPAVGEAPWDVLRHLGRDHGEHTRNGRNGHAAARAGTHLTNGHAPRRGSADS